MGPQMAVAQHRSRLLQVVLHTYALVNRSTLIGSRVCNGMYVLVETYVESWLPASSWLELLVR